MQLATLQGPDQSSGTNATGWTCLLAPPLVNVTSEGPTQLWASWVHAPRGRDSYQVTLYQAGTQASTSAVGAKVASTSFLSLTPGTKYEVEVVTQAGPLHTAAANTSGWTREAWGRQRCRRALAHPVNCWCPAMQAPLWSAWPGSAAPWGHTVSEEEGDPNSQRQGTSPGSIPWCQVKLTSS